MKKHVGVITADAVLYNKIRLLLRDVANVVRAEVGESADRYDVLLADTDATEESSGVLMIGEGGAIPRLFCHEQLLSILESCDEPQSSITLSHSTSEAYISGDAVRLTEVEYKLLEVILAADGFVSKEQLLMSVWGEGYDVGVVNVYVHYLRRKLEKNGRRVIVSSRNEGYKISENYRRKV